MRQILLTSACAAILVGGAVQDSAAQSLRFAGGPQGGAWYPLSGAIQGLIESGIEGASVQVQPGAGVSNVVAVNAGDADLGLGNAVTTVEGVAGAEPFPGPQDNVCQLLTLYFSYFHVIAPADSGIDTMTDIAGQRLTTAQRGNTGEQLTNALLAAHDISYDDLASVVHGSFSDSVSQMRDGHVDVFTAFTTIPSGAVMDLASARDIVLIHPDQERLDAMAAENPGIRLRMLPADTYPGQDEAVPSFGTWTHVMAACDLDEELAYRITEVIATNLPALTEVVAAIGGTGEEDLSADIGIPMHPGAERYFQSN